MDKKTKLIDKIDEYSSRAKKDIRMADYISKEENENYKNIIKNMFILLFYSHIEGIIKNVSKNYIDFIKKEQQSNLNCHFHFILNTEKKGVLAYLKRITGRQSNDYIDTESNLSYEVLIKILFIVNISPHKYSKFEGSIKRLLDKRNDLAHGDIKIYENSIKISDSDIHELKETALELIDTFCNDIKDCIENDSYKTK